MADVECNPIVVSEFVLFALRLYFCACIAANAPYLSFQSFKERARFQLKRTATGEPARFSSFNSLLR
jgi:hypothetical protein